MIQFHNGSWREVGGREGGGKKRAEGGRFISGQVSIGVGVFYLFM